MKEEWKTITGYPDYLISNQGRVKSLRNDKILKTPPSHYGYPRCNIFKDRIRNTILVHRYVAKEFIPNPDNKPEVNHKNGIKLDSRVDNLEWCTPKENMRHSVDNGLNGKIYYGEEHHSAKITDDEALFIRTFSHLYKTKELSNIFNLGERQVRLIITYKTRCQHI